MGKIRTFPQAGTRSGARRACAGPAGAHGPGRGRARARARLRVRGRDLGRGARRRPVRGRQDGNHERPGPGRDVQPRHRGPRGGHGQRLLSDAGQSCPAIRRRHRLHEAGPRTGCRRRLLRHEQQLHRRHPDAVPVGGGRLRLLRVQRPQHPWRRHHDHRVEPSHDRLVRLLEHRKLGQALIEFALIAPVLFLLIGATVDLGRGLLIYTMLQGASRDMARQAVLGYYSGSNTLPPTCTTLAAPCSLGPLTNGAHQLDPLGMSVVYQDSTTISGPPTYGTFVANANPLQPGTITLAGAINASTVYVFVYELDSTGGNPNPRWSCPSCAGVNGAAVRTSGHQLVVVDLKLQWKPVLNTLLGIPSSITFNSQSVERLEF